MGTRRPEPFDYRRNRHPFGTYRVSAQREGHGKRTAHFPCEDNLAISEMIPRTQRAPDFAKPADSRSTQGYDLATERRRIGTPNPISRLIPRNRENQRLWRETTHGQCFVGPSAREKGCNCACNRITPPRFGFVFVVLPWPFAIIPEPPIPSVSRRRALYSQETWQRKTC